MTEYKRREPHENILHQLIAKHYPAFRSTYGGYPDYVHKTFEAFLACGDIKQGFMRMKCPVCGEESVAAYSCKCRGFCSSCGAKRSAETAAHLIDNVLPMTRYRQVVITLPFALRLWCATNRDLFAKVYHTIKEALQRKLISKAEEIGIKKPVTGFIAFVHNWNSALALSPHFHILVMDAAFEGMGERAMIPRRLSEWKSIDLEEIIHEVVVKIVKHLQKKGYLNDQEEVAGHPTLDDLFADHEDLVSALSASLHNRRTIGACAGGPGTKIGKGFGYWEEDPVKKGRLCLSQVTWNMWG